MSIAEQTEFDQQLQACHQGTDRIFAALMAFQFVGLIIAAVWLTPLTWAGDQSSIHIHVIAAVVLGGALTLIPSAIAWGQPGASRNRYILSVSQMLVSAFYIHLLGGRIEAHFHVFGSLAFISAYRDVRVLIAATAVIAVEHLARSIWIPSSVFGVAEPNILRALEHAGYVIFEDLVLICITLQNLGTMKQAAKSAAARNHLTEQLQRDVATFSASVQRAAEGNLLRDDSQTMEVSELRELDDAFQAMLDDLRSIVADISTESRTVDEETVAATEATQKVTSMMVDQRRAAQKIKKATGHLTELINEVTSNTDRLKLKIDDAGVLAAESEDAVKQSNLSIQAMESSARQMREGIEEIKDIADQTNLLAACASVTA